MGVWGAGNFQSDAALDYLGADIVPPLVAKLQAIIDDPRCAEPDEDSSAEVMVAVDVLSILCERCGAVPRSPGWSRHVARPTCGSGTNIDKLDPAPGFKAERRAVIEASFAGLARLAREWREQAAE